MPMPREIRQQEACSYVFSRGLPAIATVVPAETVIVYIEDAFTGDIKDPEDLPSVVLAGQLNARTGPQYSQGDEPADTLVVSIDAIEPMDNWAISVFVPFFGELSGTTATAMPHEALPERLYFYELENGWLRCGDRLRIPWRPFLGTLGTALPLEAVSALTPHMHGGNMDVRDTGPGRTVYLPVYVEGARFLTGDAHANQGDGELCGVALEITAKATLTFDLVKSKPIAWPRIESDEKIMAVGNARPMEDAAWIAYEELSDRMIAEYESDKLDAYQLLSQAGTIYVGNIDGHLLLAGGRDREVVSGATIGVSL